MWMTAREKRIGKLKLRVVGLTIIDFIGWIESFI